jgi:hypothetical protein
MKEFYRASDYKSKPPVFDLDAYHARSRMMKNERKREYTRGHTIGYQLMMTVCCEC